MKGIRLKKYVIPIYYTRLVMMESSDARAVSKFLKKLGEEEERDFVFATTYYLTIKEKGNKLFCIYLILNRKYKGEKMTYSVIAHECKHVADTIFQRIDAKHWEDEPQAYLLEYLVELVCEFLNIKDEIK